MGNPHFTGPPKAKQVKQDVTVISAALHYIAHSLFKDDKTHGKREIEIKTGWGGFPTKPFFIDNQYNSSQLGKYTQRQMY